MSRRAVSPGQCAEFLPRSLGRGEELVQRSERIALSCLNAWTILRSTMSKQAMGLTR